MARPTYAEALAMPGQMLLAILASGQNADGTSAGVVDAPATTVFGSKSLTTTASLALGSQACSSVNVENPGTNLVDVLVGDSASQVYRLTPGEALEVTCSNVSQVYAKNASSTTQSVIWAAKVYS